MPLNPQRSRVMVHRLRTTEREQQMVVSWHVGPRKTKYASFARAASAFNQSPLQPPSCAFSVTFLLCRNILLLYLFLQPLVFYDMPLFVTSIRVGEFISLECFKVIYMRVSISSLDGCLGREAIIRSFTFFGGHISTDSILLLLADLWVLCFLHGSVFKCFCSGIGLFLLGHEVCW